MFRSCLVVLCSACGLFTPEVGDRVDAGDANGDDAVADASEELDVMDAATCSAPCPLDAPETDAACEGSMECEYRSNDAACSSTFFCNGATWSIPQTITTTCDESDEKPEPNCPIPRPLIGSPCTGDAACSNYWGLACTPVVACRGCMWTEELLHTCP